MENSIDNSIDRLKQLINVLTRIKELSVKDMSETDIDILYSYGKELHLQGIINSSILESDYRKIWLQIFDLKHKRN